MNSYKEVCVYSHNRLVVVLSGTAKFTQKRVTSQKFPYWFKYENMASV